jgi:alkylated DNA repair protein (DNA oxidative demethylase)
MPDLFTAASLAEERRDEAIAPGAVLLRGFALPFVDNVLAALGDITAQAPFRHMTTPWGAAMSVAMTNCARSRGNSVSRARDAASGSEGEIQKSRPQP